MNPAGSPAELAQRLTVERFPHPEWPVFRITPRGGSAEGDILYLHGGGFVTEITPLHWDLVGFLAEATHRAVVVPLYPLAPRGTARAVAEAVAGIYTHLAAEAGHAPAVVADSSGAALALALAVNRPPTTPHPESLVLLSPWLDATVSDPRSAELAPLDSLQNVDDLRRFGALFAGDEPLTSPLVSPINGDLRALGPTIVFTGTHDVLNPDAHNLAARAAAQGSRVDLREYPGMPHDWFLFPIPEAPVARRHMADAIIEAGAAREAGD